MATLSTLGQMMLNLDPGIRPYSEAELTANRIQGGRVNTQTALLQLEDLRRAQETQAAARAYYQQHPEELLGQQGQPMPILGSLGPQGGPPGAITQQPFGAGGASQAQTIPASPDASRYAAVSPQGGGPLPAGVGMPTVTPPQSTIASLTPQPQAQPSPQDRLMALARTNPEAAALIQQRMQQQQDRQSKLEEQRLDIGVKVSEAVARQLQGVTDQASMDEARERVRLIHPQAAAQIPQFYSKEAVEALQQRGIAVADVAKWRKDMATARQTEVTTEQLPKVFGALEQFATGTGGGTAPPAETTTAAPTTTRGAVPGTANLSPQFQTKAQGIANRLGANLDDFYRVMSFETGGELSPATRNRAGSGATGLIQFTPETAKALGTTTDALAKMTPEQQLDYVEKYLEPYKGKIGTLKDLYMAVLYPAALGKPDDTVLFSPDKTPTAYRQNAGLDTGKKGYVTVGDAVAAVERATGGGGRGTATTGGTGTAPAPTTDPRVAQLQARIDQGNKAALQAEAVGMEGPARQIRAQVAQLVDEKNRLQDQAITERHRGEETPRAVERERELIRLKQDLERQRQAGPMLPEQKREFFTKLRTDVRNEPTHKVYQDVRNGYQNVRIGAESDSAQGDLAIINGMAKILDPSSAVMTGEAKNVEEAQGQLQRWFNSPQRFFEGDRLTPENRQRFLKLANSLAKEKLTTAQTELKTVYGPLAKDAGIDFEQLVPLPDLKPLGPGPNVSKFEKLVAP